MKTASRMHEFPLALRYALHELRHGFRHFLIFLCCLTLGVAVIATVITLGSSVNGALSRESRALLGGDVELTMTGMQPDAKQRAFLDKSGKVSQIATLRAMLQFKDTPVLVEVKAIDAAYPLLGELKLENGQPETLFPAGKIAVDAVLLSQIGAKVGDEVRLGQAEYEIAATIAREPDRTVQIFAFGPRVMLSREALEKSGLLAPFSLVRHHTRVLLKPGYAVEAFIADSKARFPDAPWRIKTNTDGNQSVRRFVSQLEMFLTLSAFATFLIAGIGIGSSVRGYLERKLSTLAIFKILGAPLPFLLKKYLLLLGMLAGIGSVTGLIISIAATAVLQPFVAQWLPVAEGVLLDWKAAVAALGFSLLIVYAFSLPALLGALHIKPALLFRAVAVHSLILIPTRRLILAESVLIGGILALLLSISGDAGIVLGGAAVALGAFLLFLAASRFVRYLAARIPVRRPWLLLALGNLKRKGSATGTVILAIGVSLTVLVALTLVEANFQTRIREVADAEAPTLFMMDIQSAQVEGLRAMLEEAAGSPQRVMTYPMVRGRITAINGKRIDENTAAEDVRWAVRGDRGLSYSTILPENARLVAGEWWQPDYKGSPLVSIDERFIEGLGLALGSTVTLNVLGEEITAKVASARKIDYSSFQMNFAMMLSPGVLESYPQTYLATVHLPPSKKQGDADIVLLREIAKAYPNIATIRTREAVELVRDIIGHVAAALRLTVCVSLGAGILVLLSALSAMLNERLYDTAVLKVLGARKSDILKAYSAEWMLLGLLTAIIAGLVGTFAAWLVMQRLPGEAFSLLPEVTLTTIAGSLLVVWLMGYIGNRQIFNLRPAGLLCNE